MEQGNSRGRSVAIFEWILFAMLGALMFCSKIIMEAIPNVHLLGTLTMVYTLVFRTKALLPIGVFVALTGLYAGFHAWWVPYLYIWTVLWGVTMLLPRKMPRWLARIVYPAICCFHGLAFGILYAPAQALLYGFDFEQTVAWVLTGLPWDLIQGIGNLVTGLLILPLSELLKRLVQRQLSHSV